MRQVTLRPRNTKREDSTYEPVYDQYLLPQETIIPVPNYDENTIFPTEGVKAVEQDTWDVLVNLFDWVDGLVSNPGILWSTSSPLRAGRNRP